MEKRPDIPNKSESFDACDEVLAFGRFRLFPARKLLLEMDRPVVLGSRAFEILTALASRSGEVVSKEELIGRVWPGVFVDDGNLRVHIAAVRKVLGDGEGGQRYILNMPGRGYSFTEAVTRLNGAAVTTRLATPQAPAADNLPRLPRKMFGRDAVVDSLASQLPHCRLMTIVGPGGIGKTTVAMAFANTVRSRYRDGARLVDLAPNANPALVPSVLASVLGLPVSSDNLIPTLIAALRDKQVLLLLDNCEHVVGAAAELAKEIFNGAEHVHIVATSREALRVPGERVVKLASLDSPAASAGLTAAKAKTFPAIQLFVERASATLNSFELSDDNAPNIAEICQRLDGIALAIELAAGRVDVFGVSGVAARLDDRFRLLTRGHRTALPHHQTLRATFDWSYQLLAEPARLVLLRLAVFAGHFSLQSAVALAAAGEIAASDIADHVANLVSTSLVSANIAEEAPSYRMLDSMRAYAREKLIESGEFDHVARRHAEYFRNMFQSAEADLGTLPAAQLLRVYGYQLDNLRVALDWAFSSQGDLQLGIDLTIVGVPLWSRLSLNEECCTRVETALANIGPATRLEDRREMRLLTGLGSALTFTKRSDPESSDAWSRVLEIAETVGDYDYQVRALRGLFTNAYNAGDLDTATKLANRFCTTVSRSSDAADVLLGDRMMGMTFFYRGDLKEARIHTERALRGHAATKSGLNVIRFQLDQRTLTITGLSKILWLQGFPDQALRAAELGIEYARTAQHELSMAHALTYAACRIALLNGDLEEAEHYVTMLFQRALLDPSGQWDLFGRCWKGALLSRQGNFVAAARLLESSLQEIPEGSFRMFYTRFLGEFAYSIGRSGDIERASEAIEKAIRICDRRDERWFFPELLRIRGEIAVMGRPSATATAAAEEDFRHSIDWARRQGALSWELRSATSLGQLMYEQSRIVGARELLESVYGQFTEGFGTSDLKAAKLLLCKLA